MSTLITPAEVLSLAFGAEEMYNSTVITELDIAAVEERYLLPILGKALYAKLVIGKYTTLKSGYIAPMVAAWTRYNIEPLLASRCGLCHDTKPTAADNVALEARRRALLYRARSLSRALTRHLNSSPTDYLEYDADANPLNHCSIDGNVVQVY